MAVEPAQGHDRGTPEMVAARWFAKRRRRLTPPEEVEFFDWIRADLVNLAAFEAVIQAWEVSQKAADNPDIAEMRRQALSFRACD